MLLWFMSVNKWARDAMRDMLCEFYCTTLSCVIREQVSTWRYARDHVTFIALPFNSLRKNSTPVFHIWRHSIKLGSKWVWDSRQSHFSFLWQVFARLAMCHTRIPKLWLKVLKCTSLGPPSNLHRCILRVEFSFGLPSHLQNCVPRVEL